MENAPDQNAEITPEEFYRSPTTTPEADPWALDLEDIDLATGCIFQAQKHHEYFKHYHNETCSLVW